jgi:hypothetical protein
MPDEVPPTFPPCPRVGPGGRNLFGDRRRPGAIAASCSSRSRHACAREPYARKPYARKPCARKPCALKFCALKFCVNAFPGSIG